MKVIKAYTPLLFCIIFYLSCSSDKNKSQLTNNASEPAYLTKEVIAAYVVSLAALIMGGLNFYQFKISRRDQRKDLIISRRDQRKDLIISREDQTNSEINRNLWEALKWFEGGIQKRSIGIAVIEAYWNDEKRKDIRKAWIPLLINQVTHILKVSDEKDKATEQVNLERIVDLLRSASLSNNQKSGIYTILSQANHFDKNGLPVEISDKGIFIKIAQRDKWMEYFPNNQT
jgi:hypothetical protein